MQVKYSPQRSDDKLEYAFDGEIITVVLNNDSDTFDFTELSDGKLEDVETSLSINPIVSAERVDGELFVELLYYHGKNATKEELYPKWKEVE